MVHFENTMNMVPYNNFRKQYMFGPWDKDKPKLNYPFKRRPHKIVKHTQIICRQKPTNCLSVFDHFLFFLKKLGFTTCKAEQPLRGMEVQSV